LVPPSLDEWLPQNHLARFIADLVDEHLDQSAFHADYKEGRGAPPFDPRLMVRVLLLGCTTGVRSSRKLEDACWDKVAFRWLAGGQAPGDVVGTIAISVPAVQFEARQLKREQIVRQGAAQTARLIAGPYPALPRSRLTRK